MKTTSSILAAFVLALLLATSAAAQSLHIGSARALPGGSATLTVRFEASPALPVAAYQLNIAYDRVRFHAPTCTPRNGVYCHVTDLGKVVILHVDEYLLPLPTQDPIVTLRFGVRDNALPGSYSIGASFFEFVSPLADSVEGTVHTGSIRVGGTTPPRGGLAWPGH